MNCFPQSIAKQTTYGRNVNHPPSKVDYGGQSPKTHLPSENIDLPENQLRPDGG